MSIRRAGYFVPNVEDDMRQTLDQMDAIRWFGSIRNAKLWCRSEKRWVGQERRLEMASHVCYMKTYAKIVDAVTYTDQADQVDDQEYMEAELKLQELMSREGRYGR